MATLLIRDVPQAVHQALADLAGQNRRSKEKQALCLIENGLRIRKPLADLLKQSARIRSQFKHKLTMAEVLAASEEEHG